MAIVGDVIETMEKWAPAGLAEDWDNPGLLTGSPEMQITSIVAALDVTEKTIDHAIKHGASVIVSHHPSIFKPLKTLAGTDLSLTVIRRALKENIALYASHTNLDQAFDGVSYALAETLGLADIQPLTEGNGERFKFVTFCPPEFTNAVRETAGQAGAGDIGNYARCSFVSRGSGTYIPSENASPYEGTKGKFSRTDEDRIEMLVPAMFIQEVITRVKAVHPYEEMAYDIIPLHGKESSFGYGAVGNLTEPLRLNDFIGHVCSSLEINAVSFSGGTGAQIGRVAVMGGSGADNIPAAVRSGADAYITGEIGHHDYIENRETIALIDATHRGTELPVLAKIKKHIESSPTLTGIECIIDRGTAAFQIYTVNK